MAISERKFVVEKWYYNPDRGRIVAVKPPDTARKKGEEAGAYFEIASSTYIAPKVLREWWDGQTPIEVTYCSEKPINFKDYQPAEVKATRILPHSNGKLPTGQ